jgi:hypothetical protein
VDRTIFQSHYYIRVGSSSLHQERFKRANIRLGRIDGCGRVHALLADDRCCDYFSTLVSLGALPRVPLYWRRRPANARLASRHCGQQSHTSAVLPLLPANAPFAELVRLSKISIADEMREAHETGNGRQREFLNAPRKKGFSAT